MTTSILKSKDELGFEGSTADIFDKKLHRLPCQQTNREPGLGLLSHYILGELCTGDFIIRANVAASAIIVFPPYSKSFSVRELFRFCRSEPLNLAHPIELTRINMRAARAKIVFSFYKTSASD